MNINKIGYHHNHDENFLIKRPAGSGDYLLLLVLSPSKMYLNDEIIRTIKPYIIIYSKDTPQMYGADNAVYTDDWMHFNVDKKETCLFETMGIPVNTPVYIDNIHDISDMIKVMTYEFNNTYILKEDNLRLYLRLLFNKLSEACSSPKDIPHFYTINAVRSEIYNKPYLQYNVECLANRVGLSRSSFQHLYKQLFRVSVVSDIIKARTDYSAYLLTSTSLSVKEVADMCGYNSDIHMMRQFKSSFGLTPTQYRKRVKSVKHTKGRK